MNRDIGLPTTHEQYWKKDGKQLDDLGAVVRLADLKGRAARFGGKVTGIESGAGEAAPLKSKVLKVYGLDKACEVVGGSTPAMPAELKRAYAKKQPVAVVLWSPHWAYSQYDLTKLKDGKKLFGEGARYPGERDQHVRPGARGAGGRRLAEGAPGDGRADDTVITAPGAR